MKAQTFELFFALVLMACAPAPVTPVTPTPTAKNVLFIQGDHLPDNGYPHSRVRDAGTVPESFTRLRTEVLERDLNLLVDEFVLTTQNSITIEQLKRYTVVVLGANGRLFSPAELAALNQYYEQGGSMLVYADFQYGPNNWASDNGFLNPFGIEVFPDNFQPTTLISDVLTTHPVMNGVKAIQGEGISQFRISQAALAQVQVFATCSPLTRSGCIVKPEEHAKIQTGDVVACVWVRVNASAGRMAGLCDRNPLHNGPGPGSDIDQVDNRTFARNLFAWLAK